MRIEKITFQQTFPTGQFQNQKLGMEVSIDSDSELAISTFREIKRIVEAAFIALNPQINWNDRLSDSVGLPSPYNTISVYAPIPAIDPKKQDLVDKINDCTSPEELNLLMNDSMRYGLVEQFINKKKSLQ